MSLEKFKLFYNAALGEDDEVKSFLFFSDGTALTHTAGALNVNITSPLSIDVNLDHANDSVKIGDGTDLLEVNADGSLNAVISDGGGSITVDGTVAATQSGSWTVDIGNTVTVQATDLDIRDLAFATDKVDVSGSSVTATLAGMEYIGGNLSVADSALLDSLSAPAVTTSEVAVSAAANQKKLVIQNLSNTDIYYGPTGVTTTSGLIIPKQSSQEFDAAGTIYLIAGSALPANSVRVAHWTAT